jgi:subtilisin-like proprotein convertase family protein
MRNLNHVLKSFYFMLLVVLLVACGSSGDGGGGGGETSTPTSEDVTINATINTNSGSGPIVIKVVDDYTKFNSGVASGSTSVNNTGAFSITATKSSSLKDMFFFADANSNGQIDDGEYYNAFMNVSVNQNLTITNSIDISILYTIPDQSEIIGTWKTGCIQGEASGDWNNTQLQVYNNDDSITNRTSYFAAADTTCTGSVKMYEDATATYSIGDPITSLTSTNKIDYTISSWTMTPKGNASDLNTISFCGINTWQDDVSTDVIGRTCSDDYIIPQIGDILCDIVQIQTTPDKIIDGAGSSGTSEATRPTILETNTISHFLKQTDNIAPGIPSSFSATAGDGQVVLTWTNPSDLDFIGVEIRRATGSAPTTVTSGDSVYTGTLTTYTNTGLTNGTTYYYSIFAKDPTPNWSGKATASATPAGTGGDTTPPSAPTGFAATTGDMQIVLNWANPGDSDFAGVEIRRSTSSAPSTVTDGDSVYTGILTTYTNTGLTNGTTYYYSIFAKDAVPNWSARATVSETPADTTAPAIPTGFSATAGDGQVVLNWTNPSDSDFAEVEIRRSTSSAPNTESDGTSVYSGILTTYTNTGLTNGTTYYYSIFAKDEVPNWSSGANDSAAPAAGSPSTLSYSNTTSQSIPDNDTTTGISSTITVANGATSISKVTVKINITHTYDGDLDIKLQPPGSAALIELSTDNGSNGDNYTNTIFDDGAATSITSGTVPFTGSFQPEGSLASVNGSDASGDWVLHVYDDSGIDTGTLDNWTLTITGTTAGVATLSLNPTSLSVTAGSTGTITATATTDGSTADTISTAVSSDTGVATATFSGSTITVSGVSAGSATVTVTSTSGKTATCAVTVSAAATSGEIILAASDAEVEDYFGNSVSISGSYVAVGAENEDSGGSNAGAVYIFKSSGSSYNQVAKLASSSLATSDYFGTAVDISGDYVVVGAESDEIDTEYSSGVVYVFKNNGSDSFTQIAELVASDHQSSDYFGCSVAISGNYIVVGAYWEDTGGSNAGAAYVFKNDGSDNITQIAKLVSSDAEAYDYFGRSVSISGNYIIVGAYGEDAGGSSSGAAYVFKNNGSDSITQIAKLTAGDAGADDYFGRSVSINGSYIVTGAYGEDSGAYNAGAVYIFKNNGSDSYSQISKLTASDPASSAYFGSSVSIGANGTKVAIGAKGVKVSNVSSVGAAYIFKNNGSDSYSQVGKFTASDGAYRNFLGDSISIDGDNIVVGAAGDSLAVSYNGSAYIYSTSGL